MLFHDRIRKPHELVLCPKIHFLRSTFSHAPGFQTGIGRQVIIPDRIIEHGRKLILDCLQIGGRKLLFHKFVLPCPDIRSPDVTHGLLAKIWQDLDVHDILFRPHGIFP